MKFLKNNLKIIIAFIMGAILATGITVYANINASSITYSNNKTVAQALNELYNTNSNISQTNALASEILSGKKAYTTAGLVTGEMANRGALNWSPTISTTLNVEPGYYSGGTLSSQGLKGKGTY